MLSLGFTQSLRGYYLKLRILIPLFWQLSTRRCCNLSDSDCEQPLSWNIVLTNCMFSSFTSCPMDVNKLYISRTLRTLCFLGNNTIYSRCFHCCVYSQQQLWGKPSLSDDIAQLCTLLWQIDNLSCFGGIHITLSQLVRLQLTGWVSSHFIFNLEPQSGYAFRIL